MDFPVDAYAAEGVLWWDSPTWPGTRRRLGDEPRIAAWLRFNKEIGEVFTTEELRGHLGRGTGERNTAEHFQRRLRELRPRDGWEFPSVKYDRTLDVGTYRLDRIGWHPGLGTKRPPALASVSAKTKRTVLLRDGSRCVICGIGAGEPYPGRGARARLTVGHVVPAAYGGSSDLSNLRAECSECNESARSDTGMPEAFVEIQDSMRSLGSNDLRKLLGWVAGRQRTRDKVDEIYDRVRILSPGDRDMAEAELKKILGFTAR